MTHDKKEEGAKQTDEAAKSNEEGQEQTHEGMPLDDIKLNEDGGTVESDDEN